MLQEETESRGWRNWTGGGVGLLGAGAGGGVGRGNGQDCGGGLLCMVERKFGSSQEGRL